MATLDPSWDSLRFDNPDSTQKRIVATEKAQQLGSDTLRVLGRLLYSKKYPEITSAIVARSGIELTSTELGAVLIEESIRVENLIEPPHTAEVIQLRFGEE